jgi:hypothetical protein
MGVARESDEAGVRKERRKLPAAADRHRAVAAAVQHERRRRHRGQVGARVRGEIQLEETRGDVGVRRVALVAAERLDLLAPTARDEETGEHLRGQQPVHAREIDE